MRCAGNRMPISILTEPNPPLSQDPSPELSRPINLPDFSGLDLDFDIVDSHHHLFDLAAV